MFLRHLMQASGSTACRPPPHDAQIQIQNNNNTKRNKVPLKRHLAPGGIDAQLSPCSIPHLWPPFNAVFRFLLFTSKPEGVDIMRHLEHLLGLLKNVSRKGKGYRACCPAHDDANPSLDIVMDDEKNIILRCRSADCKLTDILKAIDMCPDDLSPDPDEEIFTNDDYDLAKSDAPSCDPKRNDVDFDLRSKIYSTLCDGLELSEEHREDLQRRGLDDSDIDQRGYRSLTNAGARDAIAHLRTVHSDAELLCVPGFVADPDAGVRLVGPGQGLIIPCRDPQERIVALKVRRDDGSGQVGKYSCISGGGGPSCGTPTHVPLGIKQPVPIVRVTEGELKADTATVRSDIPTIGIAGVSNWRSALPVLQSLGVKSVYLAFDSDCQTKPHVARPLREFAEALRERGYDVNIEIWNPEDGKGIDDLLASGKEPKVLAGEEAFRFVKSLLTETEQPTEHRKNKHDDQRVEDDRPAECEVVTKNGVLSFPIDTFPEPLQRYVKQAARSLGCPIDFIAILVLVVAATAIGASRAIQPKPGWRELPIFFAAIVAPPGSGKSPADSLVMKPLHKLQHLYKAEYRREKEQQKARAKGCTPRNTRSAATCKAVNQLRLTNASSMCHVDPSDVIAGVASVPTTNNEIVLFTSKQVPPTVEIDQPIFDATDYPVQTMQEPTMRRIIVSDTTTEALAKILAANPRGLLQNRDELSSWIRSMNQYRGGKGTDRQFFLSCWSAQSATVDRKSQEEPLMIARPCLSISGGIQPDMLSEFADPKGRVDGLMDRFLTSYPDSIALAKWTEIGVDDATAEVWEGTVDRLLRLEMRHNVEWDVYEPITMELSPDAKVEWITWHDQHVAETQSPEFPDTLRGPWQKLKSYCLRLALVMELTHSAADQHLDVEYVDCTAITRAIKLIDYFKSHARKVYANLILNGDDRRIEVVVKWIQRHGGECTVRDLQRSKIANIKKSSEARQLMTDMVDRGLGTLVPRTNKQGKEVTYLVLNGPVSNSVE